MKLLLLFTILLMSVSTLKSDTKTDDIRKLLAIENIEATLKATNTRIISFMLKDMADDYEGIVDSLSNIINEKSHEMIDSVVFYYDKHFTHQEIKEIIKFYETPIGKKVKEVNPILMEEIFKVGGNWATTNQEYLKTEIEKRLGHFKKLTLTYEDFYKPDEEFEYLEPYEIVSSSRNDQKVAANFNRDYLIAYNSNYWETIPSKDVNSVASLAFKVKDKEIYAMVIAENEDVDIYQLKAIALMNAYNGSKYFELLKCGIKSVNNQEVLSMKYLARIKNEVFYYDNLYYAGDWSVLQFIVFAKEADYKEHFLIIEELLSGLIINNN